MADQTKPEKKATIQQTTTIVSHTRARVEQQVTYNHSEAGTVRLFVERLSPASIKNIPLLRAAKKPPTTQTFVPLQILTGDGGWREDVRHTSTTSFPVREPIRGLPNGL
jgi:type IV secretory pathway VirJ component